MATFAVQSSFSDVHTSLAAALITHTAVFFNKLYDGDRLWPSAHGFRHQWWDHSGSGVNDNVYTAKEAGSKPSKKQNGKIIKWSERDCVEQMSSSVQPLQTDIKLQVSFAWGLTVTQFMLSWMACATHSYRSAKYQYWSPRKSLLKQPVLLLSVTNCEDRYFNACKNCSKLDWFFFLLLKNINHFVSKQLSQVWEAYRIHVDQNTFLTRIPSFMMLQVGVTGFVWPGCALRKDNW